MELIDKAMDLWKRFLSKAEPVFQKISAFWKEFKKAFRVVWRNIYRMRKVVLVLPVAAIAVILAIYNLANLPPLVGFDMQTNGEFAIQIIRELAVLGPLAITAVCLLLVFASKRILTPWLVSVFSLLVPVAILITNVFPK